MRVFPFKCHYFRVIPDVVPAYKWDPQSEKEHHLAANECSNSRARGEGGR